MTNFSTLTCKYCQTISNVIVCIFFQQGLRALHVAAKKDDVDALELLVKDKRSVNDPAPVRLCCCFCCACFSVYLT